MKLTDVTSWLSGTDAVFGLEVYVNLDLTKEYRLAHIVKKNGELHMKSSLILNTIEDLLLALPVNSAVVLVCNGKGVIHRNHTITSSLVSEVVQTTFPNLKEQDFFYQNATLVNGGVLSLIRKDIVLDIISSLQSKKIHVLSLLLGPFATVGFFNLIGLRTERFFYDRYQITLNGQGEIVEYSIVADQLSDDIKIQDEHIPSVFVNTYTAACLYVLGGADGISSSVFDLHFEEQKKIYKSVLLKHRGGLVLLVSALLVLLINFVVFSSLRKVNIQYQDQLTVSQTRLDRLDSLENFIKVKKLFISKAGWTDKMILSEPCDKIAQSVPAEIKLTELTIHPINIAESRNTKEIVFENKKIVVKGFTKKIAVLNDWLKQVDAQTFVRDFKMKEYHFDTNAQEGYFQIEGILD